MKNLVFHPIYSQLSLPDRHRFPIEKYQGIYDGLIAKGVEQSRFVTPAAVPIQHMHRFFDRSYVDELTSGALNSKAMRRIGFPWSEQLIQRSLTAVGGTIRTAQLALQHGVALNLTGGYHHAFTDYGSGFCLFNDLYLAANEMLLNPAVGQVLIIDLDVHQGDGTAKLTSERNDIITLSLHCEKNFPFRKQVSDMDFPLDKNLSDEQYLSILDEALSLAFRCYQPDAVIYDAGVDIHENDDLGLLNVTTQGVLTRDSMVIDLCKRHKLPVACVIGGGYQRDINALVDVHLQLYRAAGVYV
ncbi:histone deacetylase [Alteromonas sp. 5E99-2]|uniref:histone deacetylase family protein n=1 Tax=Alteromonas sp. 5E99-2 TaxID=2817683 RepID=UPI001A99E7A6|nr:histone deacetylase [Alteromonas sp. 5E99-2]MBO1255348.1 histone deacetylase [Alteromonas sp. 5E99-2]